MEATKIKCPVVGKVFKADELKEFLDVNARLRSSDYEHEMRIIWNGKQFAGGIILAATQPREAVKIPFFLRLSNYEALELSRGLRAALKRTGNTLRGTVTRTPNGTTYEARFDRDGYNIAVTAAALSEIKSKFIEAAIAVEGV